MSTPVTEYLEAGAALDVARKLLLTRKKAALARILELLEAEGFTVQPDLYDPSSPHITIHVTWPSPVAPQAETPSTISADRPE